MKLKDLGGLLERQRGSMGIRAAAKEIGISPTTLSKVEKGHIPDQLTLKKICDWLGESASQFTALGGLQIAFKKNRSLSAESSASLAVLIKRAEEQFKQMATGGEGH